NPQNTGPHDGIPDRVLVTEQGSIFQSFKPSFYLKGKEYLIENGVVREAHYDGVYPVTPGELSSGNGGDARRIWAVEQLFAKVDSGSVMGRADYQISDHIDYKAYFEYTYNSFDDLHSYPRFDTRNGANSPIARIDNPYLPDSLRQIMVS